MILFALDSATGAAGAAVWQDGRILAESYADIGLTHSQTLMPLCDEVFRRTGLTPADVDCFAVTDGPGSFTGLRIGIGTIKGMAFAADKPCVPVSTLEALAWNVCGSTRTAVALCDARRGRVYHAAFAVEQEVRRLCEDTVVDIAQLPELYRQTPVLLIGDAARLCYNEVHETMDCALPAPGNLMPRAASVAAAAALRARRGDTVLAGELAPRYIQIPQAERERKEREQQP